VTFWSEHHVSLFKERLHPEDEIQHQDLTFLELPHQWFYPPQVDRHHSFLGGKNIFDLSTGVRWM